MTPAFPKPVRRPPKARKPLRARPWGVRRKVAGPRPSDVLAMPKPRRELKTKHARRARETGFMAFCHVRGCEMGLDADLQRMLEINHLRCRGKREFAHLSDLKRYDKGDIGAVLCESIHRGIDGKEGGKATWYTRLERYGQNLVRMRLANRARAVWDGLSAEKRAHWDELAESRRGRRG